MFFTLDDDQRYAAMCSRDPRFDGIFTVAVTTTGIYCRPSCPATTPKRVNVQFFPTSATAQVNGFRACKRCRPDASPGSPEWNVRGDVVARAMRLIADGVVDRAGVGGLARRLHYSERHLTRLITDELGAGPLSLARAQRARTARILIETSSLNFTDIAFAAGFSSVRQFNDTIREVFAVTPSEMRSATASGSNQDSRGTSHQPSQRLILRLAYRTPFDAEGLFAFLALRAVPGVEWCDGTTYRRTLGLPHGHGIVEVRNADSYLLCEMQLADWRDLTTAVDRVRRLFDLDADPRAVAAHLGSDPLLGHIVAAHPGRRSPGAVDGAELAVRAVLGQQVSVVGARTLAGRLVKAVGEPLTGVSDSDLTHVFPVADALAGLDPESLSMPRSRGRALLGMCAAIADGQVCLDRGADTATVYESLVALPGIGPWTAQYVAMRALGDPDVFMPADLGVRHALERLGVDGSPKAAAALAQRWSPWRSYALHHLWSTL